MRNFKPSSLLLVSPLDAIAGTVLALQIEQGHVRVAMLIVMPAPGVSTFALSSTARLLSVIEPATVGVHVCCHVLLPGVHPEAGCHVAPPSTQTSTPATSPPVSVTLPAIVADCCNAHELVDGMMADAGGAGSGGRTAATQA